MINNNLSPKKIGIIGGGQLGMMTSREASRMGYETIVWDPVKDSPAFKIADKIICDSFSSFEAAEKFSSLADVVTFEFENIDYEILKFIETRKNVFPNCELLQISQNRELEKETLLKNNFPIVPFIKISSISEIDNAVLNLNYPVVIKTATQGYDGKGQWIIKNQDELNIFKLSYSSEEIYAVVEKYINLDKEFSVIVAKSSGDKIVTFPLIENEHRNNILHKSVVSSKIDKAIENKAIYYAVEIAKYFNLRGILCVEMFLDKSGELFVNEIAPRPHNSGHFSIDACDVSQFEMQVRTVCGLEIFQPKLISNVAMINILGKHFDNLKYSEIYKIPGIKLHLYGKTESRPQRKMGHINILGDSENEVLEKINLIENIIGEN